MKKTISLLILILFSVIPAYPSPITGKEPQDVKDKFFPDGRGIKVEVWIENLEIPWSLIFLPDGRALVSERPGRIRLIKNNRLQEKPYIIIDVAHIGEGGLMGLALHPAFPKQPFIYAMHTYRKGGDIFNRVIRIRDQGEKGDIDKVIADNIPAGKFHNGGRISFRPDGMLYIAAGETFNAEIAQVIQSLGGKILRVTQDGGIPPDNPFKGSPVYSYGHRNPQGLAWHPETGDLFSSEHGPSGEFLKFGNDEINVIRKGGNYGWPQVIGSADKKPFIDPLIAWKKTTPPSGMTFYAGDKLPHLRGDLFVATLRSQSLIRIRIKKESGGYRVTDIERWFVKGYDDNGKYGRLRDVVVGPDGLIYFLTNNTDGRGNPSKGDDRIYRIVPE
ncbi:MAG TPA: glucose dehydrogenase [Nitrospiraceae bacterium]|nr:glucose dehydrogenase [Nitrospiraceae bacterium]